jgi:hypothetical protein
MRLIMTKFPLAFFGAWRASLLPAGNMVCTKLNTSPKPRPPAVAAGYWGPADLHQRRNERDVAGEPIDARHQKHVGTVTGLAANSTFQVTVADGLFSKSYTAP